MTKLDGTIMSFTNEASFTSRIKSLWAELFLFFVACILSIFTLIISYRHDWILAYGDAESHIDIAKRVVSGLTPGLAQLGGIWLPLQHLLMVPFVINNSLWRTSIGGSFVSAFAYVVSSIVLYKIIFLLTKRKSAGIVGTFAFLLNPNILYMQTTPMTELTLIMFFLLSSYFFMRYLYKQSDLSSLILAALFGFCASLTRYDGWFLVGIETIICFLSNWAYLKTFNKAVGQTLLYTTFAFFGIFLWLLWGYLILGDPFYFTNSTYSAHTQQLAWLARHELPAYKNISLSLIYYVVTAVSNIGLVLSLIAGLGVIRFVLSKDVKRHIFVTLLLATPFIFNVISLYVGQDVIFIPYLTPKSYPWHLFNVRYGMLMVPTAVIFFGYLFAKSRAYFKAILIVLLFVEVYLFGTGFEQVMTLADGVSGLSAAKHVDAQSWMATHYDKGLVLLDDYARTMSVIKSNIPMQNVIYVGTKPYWERSLAKPERYATWIIMQQNDAVWNGIYKNKKKRDELYAYFNKVYSSKEILIFKRIGKEN